MTNSQLKRDRVFSQLRLTERKEQKEFINLTFQDSS